MKFNSILVALLFAALVPVRAATEREIIHAVVMEASGEPYAAQVAVCAVIRNRGNSLKGIYGATVTRFESPKVYAQVEKAWKESATKDPTKGCDMFGGVIDDKYFKGKLNLDPVITIGKTRFYKSPVRKVLTKPPK